MFLDRLDLIEQSTQVICEETFTVILDRQPGSAVFESGYDGPCCQLGEGSRRVPQGSFELSMAGLSGPASSAQPGSVVGLTGGYDVEIPGS